MDVGDDAYLMLAAPFEMIPGDLPVAKVPQGPRTPEDGPRFGPRPSSLVTSVMAGWVSND